MMGLGRRVCASFIFIGLGLSLAACNERALEAKLRETVTGPRPADIPIPVEAALPLRGTISSYFETTSRIEAERRVDVAAEAIGICASVSVEEGDTVQAGDVLAELDKEEAEALLRQIEVQVRQHETSLELAKRQTREGHGTQVDRDNARFRYETSLADHDMQRIRLDNLTIRAPIAGIVTQKTIQPGMYVSIGMTAFTIMDPSSLMLVIHPPEKDLPRLRVGQSAQVRIDALPGKVFEASIRRINPSVDPVSGTIKVVLDLKEANRSRLPESAFARVKLVMNTRKNVLMVPKEAVLEEGGRKYVFIVKTDTEDSVGVAHRIEVGTGLEDNDYIQIFRGLTDEDQVVTNGHHALNDGSRVNVTGIADEIQMTADRTADEALAAAKIRRESGEQQTPRRRQGGPHH
ncbi:MAG: efflux RND transporter periplasmic adaptor subunit [Candidatus Hydrogenedentes bacterium]|nr:efflux RND transporter periplasmic adaptor subunit [Candidatus Hydrogenedentota bacterium]